MKTQSSSKKTIYSAVVIIGALIVTFYLFSKNSTPSSTDSLVQVQNTPDASAASARILNLLNQIKSLKIDTTLFSDPAYKTLVDYSVSIPEVNVGRPNPFAPIPGFIESPAPAAK